MDKQRITDNTLRAGIAARFLRDDLSRHLFRARWYLQAGSNPIQQQTVNAAPLIFIVLFVVLALVFE